MNNRTFYQWDLDQRIELTDVAVGTEIHYCNPQSKETECLTVYAKEENGVVYADVPNVILQIAGSFKVYVWPFHTTAYMQYPVIARPKPSDYIYEEVEILSIEKVVENALIKAKESGDFKGDPGDNGDPGYTPQKGIDYWTPEEVGSMESILRTKAANIGGFVPVNAPLIDGSTDLNKTTVTVTDVVENDDGSHTVIFNRAKNEFADGGFEQYHTNESLVPLNSFGKSESGWSGLDFGTPGAGIVRFAEVRAAQTAGESHSGHRYIEVWGRYSSLCKSLKLKPYTQYTLSFWLKGPVATAAINNISVMAKAYDGDVIYENVGGAYWRSTDASKYQELYNGSFESIPNAVIQNANIWQECKINFKTESNEYVDIFFYFGDNSWQYFYFDDFSVTENVGPEFTAAYAAGVEVPPEVAVGSVFYIERDNGRAFTRFEYASSYAIKELYKYTEQLNKTAFEDLTKEIGNISSVLDDIITLQNSLIGGESE